jgi:hypothetical protein
MTPRHSSGSLVDSPFDTTFTIGRGGSAANEARTRTPANAIAKNDTFGSIATAYTEQQSQSTVCVLKQMYHQSTVVKHSNGDGFADNLFECKTGN